MFVDRGLLTARRSQSLTHAALVPGMEQSGNDARKCIAHCREYDICGLSACARRFAFQHSLPRQTCRRPVIVSLQLPRMRRDGPRDMNTPSLSRFSQKPSRVACAFCLERSATTILPTLADSATKQSAHLMQRTPDAVKGRPSTVTPAQ